MFNLTHTTVKNKPFYYTSILFKYETKISKNSNNKN